MNCNRVEKDSNNKDIVRKEKKYNQILKMIRHRENLIINLKFQIQE